MKRRSSQRPAGASPTSRPRRVRRRAALAAVAFCTGAFAAGGTADAPDLAALVDTGDRLLAEGDAEGAWAYYDRALAVSLDEPRALAGAAAALEALDEEAAAEFLTDAFTTPWVPSSPAAAAVLAALFARAGAEERAAALLETLPLTGRGYLVRGQMSLTAGDLPEAIRNLKEARGQGQPAAAYFLGEALLAARRYDEAAVYLNEFLRNFPAAAPAWSALGEVRYHRREYSLAKEAFVTALSFDAHDRRATYDLGLLARRERDYQSAIKWFGKLVADDPRDERAWAALIETYGRVDGAVARAKKAEYERLFGKKG